MLLKQKKTPSFIGRQTELDSLSKLQRKKQASLVTIQGRRRIGKSTLIKYFSKKYSIPLFEFIGLPPRKGLKNTDQLKQFSKTLANYLNLSKIECSDWNEAFVQLSKLAEYQKGQCLILLDEISWLGGKDQDFSGKLKDHWDRSLSQQSNLILVLCGSVSSWIQENILNNTGFVGRVALEITLPELSLAESYELLQKRVKNKIISIQDFAQIVSITGGVPRYLEEINIKETAENNIKDICFNPSGLLFQEFEKLFSELFGRRNQLYQTILTELSEHPLSPANLAKKLKLELNGDFSDYLKDLELSGFIKRDFSWNFDGKESKHSMLRISDNYSKFYLKYIYPRRSRLIKKPLKADENLEFLNWPSIFGYQFENCIYSSLNKTIELMGIPSSEIIQLGPYFQTKTKIQQGVQIDLMVQCKKGQLHLCEIKSGRNIGKEVILEMQEKTQRLKIPRGFSIRHYLIYLGNLTDGVLDAEYFDKIISFDSFLELKK